jgi:hypothetical protein
MLPWSRLSVPAPRLLDISSEEPRVLPGTSCPPGSQWTTLSYKWGDSPASLKLTAENLVRLTDCFPSTLLPRTFRDAAELCRSIDLYYTWTDSLCILQSGEGSPEDWLQHVTEMRQVYWNVHLNFSADWRDSPESGLFTSRDTKALQTPLFRFQIGPLTGPVVIGCVEDEIRGSWDSPLSTRGWILQERLLSPRSFVSAGIKYGGNALPLPFTNPKDSDDFDFDFVYPTFRKLSTAPSPLESQSGESSLDYFYVDKHLLRTSLDLS